MTPKVHELSDHVERLTPRLQLIEQLQDRLSELHQLSGDIDRKLAAQLSSGPSSTAFKSRATACRLA